MILEDITIVLPGYNQHVCLTHMRVVEQISMTAHGTFSPGFWLLANRFPWYKGAKEPLSRMLPRLSIEPSQMVFGVPGAVAKAQPLAISNVPTGVWRLSFILISALPAVLSASKFKSYYEKLHINPVTAAAAILNFFQDSRVHRLIPSMTPAASSSRERRRNSTPRGRPRLDLEALSNQRYACAVVRQRIFTPALSSLLGVDSSTPLSIKQRREATTILLRNDPLSRSAAVSVVTSDEQLGKQALSASGALADNIAHGLAVPLWVSLLMKDTVVLSDNKMRKLSSSRSKTAVTDSIQFSRVHDIMQMRKFTNDVVVEKFGLVDIVEEEGCVRALCDLPRVLKMHVYSAMSRGCTELRRGALLRWKLTFDGTDAGGKSLLVFGLIPLSLGVKAQSNSSVFPFAVSWVSESTASLTSTVPGLTECIAELHSNGLEINLPDGVCQFPVRIDIAADMSSLWKLNGIGSASKSKSCIYCNASSETRQHIGDTISDLNNPANFRTDLLPIFGLPLEQTHICTLHALTRVTEKLVKLIAVHCVALDKRHTIAVNEAKTKVKNAEDAVRLAEMVGRGRGRGGRASHGLEQSRQSVEDAKLALARSTAVYNALVAVRHNHGSTTAMAAAVVRTGVLQKTFNINVVQHVRGDGATIEVSSFTGTQAQKLLGCYTQTGETPPYVEVVHGAYGICAHHGIDVAVIEERGLLETDFCIVCNVLFLFRVFGSQLLPVLQAISVDELSLAFQKAFPNTTTVFCERIFHERFQKWGAVLVHTFYGGGSRSLISDYCKPSFCCFNFLYFTL